MGVSKTHLMNLFELRFDYVSSRNVWNNWRKSANRKDDPEELSDSDLKSLYQYIENEYPDAKRVSAAVYKLILNPEVGAVNEPVAEPITESVAEPEVAAQPIAEPVAEPEAATQPAPVEEAAPVAETANEVVAEDAAPAEEAAPAETPAEEAAPAETPAEEAAPKKGKKKKK